MTVGTKSILFGAHAFWLHPFFVAAAWWRLFGFPWDPRLWFSFFLHDIGYWGKPNMDGPEGKRHPILGALVMGILFGRSWYDFTLFHSRHFAKAASHPPSDLCFADKLAFSLTPKWLYLPMVRASGELREYLSNAAHASSAHWQPLTDGDASMWHDRLSRYMRDWVEVHMDGSVDTWTRKRF